MISLFPSGIVGRHRDFTACAAPAASASPFQIYMEFSSVYWLDNGSGRDRASLRARTLFVLDVSCGR